MARLNSVRVTTMTTHSLIGLRSYENGEDGMEQHVNVRRREIDLINKRIIDRTKKVFPEETTLMLASTNLMRRVTSVSKDAIKEFSETPNLPAVMNLFARNRSLVHFSIACLMNGGYAPTKILSRASLESILCMRLFNENPDLAKE